MDQTTSGAAATPNAAEDIGDEMMLAVAGKLGARFPTETKDDSGAGDEPAAEEAGESPGDEGDANPAATGETAGDEGEPKDETTAGAEDNADETATGDEKKPGAEYAEDTAKLLNTRLKDLPTEQRKVVEGIIGARIGQVVAKERGERERMGARVDELTAENEKLAAEKGPRYVSSDTHPTETIDNDRDLAQREGELDRWIAWAEDHADGVEPTGEPGEEGYKPGYTKQQIREQARTWKTEKEKLIPQVRENLRARAQGDEFLKGVFPQLFDAKSEEYRMAQHFLKTLPAIKRFVDYRAIVAQQILGQRELNRLIEAKKAGGKTAAPTGKAKSTVNPPLKKVAPRAPGSGTQARGSVVARERDEPAASTAVANVYKDPTNKKAFAGAVGALLGSDFN